MNINNRNKLVGDRIKEARILRNMTLDDIADDVRVAKSTIQRYETAKIKNLKMPVIQSIAKSLDVNPVWLMGENVPMERTGKDKINDYIFEKLNMPYDSGRKFVYQVEVDSQYASIIEKAINMHIHKSELEMIQKFRILDAHGKDMVDTILSKEFDRCKPTDESWLPEEEAYKLNREEFENNINENGYGMAARNGKNKDEADE